MELILIGQLQNTLIKREILGKDKLLCVEQKVVLTEDKQTAYSAAKSI